MKMKSKAGSKAVGLYSYKDNPMPKASKVKPMAGGGSNSDAQKVNSLLQKAQMKEDSLRGKSGM